MEKRNINVSSSSDDSHMSLLEEQFRALHLNPLQGNEVSQNSFLVNQETNTHAQDLRNFCSVDHRNLQQHHPSYFQNGFMNNAINSPMRRACNNIDTNYRNICRTSYENYLRRHKAFIEAAALRNRLIANNCDSPPWKGCVVSMAIARCQSQYLQAKIEEGNPIYVELIISEVKGHVHQLMKHDFGNYVIQKIFESRKGITWELMDYFVYVIISNLRMLQDVCMDNHGTRVIQIMLENIMHPITQYDVACTMKRIAVSLMTNVNGSYVIVQCMKLFPSILKKIILDELARVCVDIANNKFGCSAIQKCLRYGGIAAIGQLVTEIISNAIVLAEDPSGNYVLQCVIEMELPFAKELIIEELHGKFVRLCMNKYSSNVVEDLLRYSDYKGVTFIVDEIMRSRDFLKVLQDPFGNYVVQSALKCTQGHLRRQLCYLIKSHQRKLHSHLYGKKVLTMAMAYIEGNMFYV